MCSQAIDLIELFAGLVLTNAMAPAACRHLPLALNVKSTAADPTAVARAPRGSGLA